MGGFKIKESKGHFFLGAPMVRIESVCGHEGGILLGMGFRIVVAVMELVWGRICGLYRAYA